MVSHGATQAQQPGHHWTEPDRVRWFVARMDARAAEREPQFRLLAQLIPFDRDTPIKVLDVGGGYGAEAAFVLEAFPSASVTVLDISEEMARIGRERLAAYAGRFAYLMGDFADGRLPDASGGDYHAIISSLAIHHLPPTGKQSLYRDIAGRLRPGGVFLNLDSVAAQDATLQTAYDRAAALDPPPPPVAPVSPPVGDHHSEMQPLADHLRWLEEAGLMHVDCFWKRLGSALFGGYKA